MKSIHAMCLGAVGLLSVVSARAQYAYLPEAGRFNLTPGYSFQTFNRFWLGDMLVQNPPNGDSLYQHTGFVNLEYGLCASAALDVTVGYGSSTTSAFPPGGVSKSDSGLTDTLIGLRVRLMDENDHTCPWVPTVALRVGGIIEGSYDANFPFSIGDGASGGEFSLLFSRTWYNGFGFYGDVGYRVRTEDVPEDFFASAGFLYTYKRLTLSAGYRHVQGLSGPDIGDPGFGSAFGFPQVKEISQNVEVGLGFLDSGGRYYQLFAARPFAGRNTGEKWIVGATISFSF